MGPPPPQHHSSGDGMGRVGVGWGRDGQATEVPVTPPPPEPTHRPLVFITRSEKQVAPPSLDQDENGTLHPSNTLPGGAGLR